MTSRYHLFMAAAAALSIAKVLALARVLGVESFGLYNLALVISNYAIFAASAGLIEGAAVVLPRLFGQDRGAQAVQLTRCVVARFLLVGAALSGTLGLLGALLLDDRALVLAGVSLAVAGGVVIALSTHLRSAGDLVRYGRLSLWRTLAALLLGLLGALAAGFYGAIAGEVLGLVILAAAVWRATGLGRTDPGGAADRVSLAEVLREGVPLLRHQFLIQVQQSYDRWLVVWTLGAVALGQYSFAMLLMTASLMVHAIASQQFGPALIRTHAQGRPLSDCVASLDGVVLRIALAFLPAAGLAWAGAWLAGGGPFSSYREGLDLVPIVLVGCAFQMTYLYDWVVVAAGKTAQLSHLSLAITVLMLALGSVGWLVGFGLRHYAMLMVLGRMLMWVAAFTLARRVALVAQ